MQGRTYLEVCASGPKIYLPNQLTSGIPNVDAISAASIYITFTVAMYPYTVSAGSLDRRHEDSPSGKPTSANANVCRLPQDPS